MVDSLFVFSDGQTDIGSDQTSDYVMDLVSATNPCKDAFGNTILNPLSSDKLYLNVMVTTVIGTALLTVTLVTSSDATIATADTHVCELSIPLAAPVGSCWSVGVANHDVTWLRYVGVVYDSASSGCTGAVDCWLDTSPCTGNVLPH